MTKTTYSVTAPTGEVLTRTSQNRIYTHAIIARHSYETAMASASLISATDKKNHDFYVAMANGTDRLSIKPEWRTQAEHDKYIAGFVEQAAEFPNRDAYAEAKRATRVEAIEALKKSGYFGRFVALTWCGRPDLAQKELSKALGHAGYVDAQALAVTIKGKG